MKDAGAEDPRAIKADRDASARGPGDSSTLFRGLSKSAIIIGIVSLLSDVSGEMIYPILPVFLTETLHAPATVLGLVEGIAVGASTAIGGLSGWISDRLGRRKPIAFAGYELTSVT